MQSKFALLTTVNSPLVGYLIRELININILPEFLVYDSKGFSKKDLIIYQERTEGKMPPICFSDFASYEIPCYFVENHNDQNCVSLTQNNNIDLLVNAGTPRILAGEILDIAKYGVINCHPGLLPEFRGCSCVEWAIYYDKKIGNSVHKISEGIDDGPLICKEELVFPLSYIYSDIRVKVFKAGVKLYVNTIKDIIENNISCKDYIEQKNGKYFKPIDQEKFRIVKSKIKQKKYKYQI